MNAIALPVALPLLAAFLIPSLNRSVPPLARMIGPATLLACLYIVLDLALSAEVPVSVAMGGFLPPLGINFYGDQVALMFAALVAAACLLLWPWGVGQDGQEQDIRIHSLYLLLAASASGLALSGDLFNIYVFYELVSVASFGLVAARNTGACFIASFRYLTLSALGTVLALSGIALVYSQTGTLNLAQLSLLAPDTLNNPMGLAAFALILIGVGVKAELFPVNAWVPEVYATTTVRVTALLAGLVSKIAVLVIVRALVLVFPGEEARALMMVLGMLGVFAGEFSAWRATDFNRMLAYSSIGQLGMVLVAFSIPGDAGLLAGLALALHHLIVKPGLFLLADQWAGALSRLQGRAWGGTSQMFAALLFVLFALSLVGVPPLPGFWAKLQLVLALVAQQSALSHLALAVILLATVVEANYLFRFSVSLFGSQQGSSQGGGSLLKLADSALLGLVLIAAAIFITPLADGLQTMATEMADVALYTNTVLEPNDMAAGEVGAGQ
ncbi:MAG: complex I subunit 5 family protein [Gammaproteobacteria bacterium]